MLTDLVVNSFGTHLADMVELARAADDLEIGALWFNDHFSGHVVDAPWSRDPFVSMGAAAVATDRVDIGLLVANLTNRHPVQLASAINSVQSLAPDRVRLGVGSGAAPNSRFASEHEMIDKQLGDAAHRGQLLRDSIEALRLLWAGESSFSSTTVAFDGVDGIVDDAAIPPIIVGASSWSTIEVAVELADGVNIRRTADLATQLDRLAARELRDGFEISVLEYLDRGTPLSERPSDLVEAGVHRRIVTLSPGTDLDVLHSLTG